MDFELDMAIINTNTDSPVTPETDIKMKNIEGTTFNNNRLVSSEQYENEKETCFKKFDSWSPEDQIDFIEDLLLRMTHYQHGHINTFLKPMLQRDFISALPGKLCSYILSGHLDRNYYTPITVNLNVLSSKFLLILRKNCF